MRSFVLGSCVILMVCLTKTMHCAMISESEVIQNFGSFNSNSNKLFNIETRFHSWGKLTQGERFLTSLHQLL